MIATIALIRDTFSEAFARRIFWGFFACCTALLLFLMFILRIDVVEGRSPPFPSSADHAQHGRHEPRRADTERDRDDALFRRYGVVGVRVGRPGCPGV